MQVHREGLWDSWYPGYLRGHRAGTGMPGSSLSRMSHLVEATLSLGTTRGSIPRMRPNA